MNRIQKRVIKLPNKSYSTGTRQGLQKKDVHPGVWLSSLAMFLIEHQMIRTKLLNTKVLIVKLRNSITIRTGGALILYT